MLEKPLAIAGGAIRSGGKEWEGIFSKMQGNYF